MKCRFYIDFDACGVLAGDSSSCAGCDKIANSGLKLDACAVCGGDSSSCVGCDDVPNSGLKFDACGVCDGDSLSCVSWPETCYGYSCDWLLLSSGTLIDFS